ncbi:CDP-diacylglycerol--serine O-phosphatidyltransferase [Methanothrix harundinacea]|uniref:CDP-diacylglycerol--serine O-phosphatidyltransferase n=1 Tax=Methanothrix harundinacea (strain 6Ac) TaxID=1110509 RepID=G7WR83_METH6|nr:CDP-diacylglycerol--serine O-phosphatidyltransferase [Methanothrix harundinacea]AET65544.1 CDP-diacylglycerol/serineO-phosphatidyltransfera se [Methanothrix harundinacea 6Ac]
MTGIIRLLRLPDLVSILNASLGFSSLLMAAAGRLELSAALIFLAVAADGLDGLLARKVGDGPLGTQIDSLADLVSFGAAPAFLAWSAFGAASAPGWGALGAFYLACGILRLARFNLSPRLLAFEGMPIPGAGGMVAAAVLLAGPLPTALILFATSLLMISSVPYPKFRDPRLFPPVLGLGAAAAAAWALGAVRLSAGIVFLALAGYLGSPVVMEICRRRGKRPPSRRG